MPAFLFQYTSWDDWRGWLDDHALRLLVIAGILLLAEITFRKVISRVLSGAITRAARARQEDRIAIRRRADTLSATLNWGFGALLGFLGLGLFLGELGLNVSALVAGVGIVGIAIGLGAQTLVKDVLNGLFILIEDQYAVGDTVTVAGATGEVVEINPRRTVIRDDSGNLHSIPNSAITIAVNRTPGLNRFKVHVVVAFRDSDAAADLIGEASKELAEAMRADLLAAPKLAAQTVLADGDVRLTVVCDAKAPVRWQVEAELRRRLKRRFDAERMDMRFDTGDLPLQPRP
ncbi:MAG: hypothetical protein C0506_15195 [Anaerolinea sp.]|nr:hypothetical protein [Anaerolinea sp.]